MHAQHDTSRHPTAEQACDCHPHLLLRTVRRSAEGKLPGSSIQSGDAIRGGVLVAFVDAAGITMHYDVSGSADAPVVVLANSLGTSVHMWDDQVGPLSASYRVLRYDMRGHGLTECSPAGDDAKARVEVLADDVAALLDALGIERVRFVG